MTETTEQAVMSQMGLAGLGRCVEAVTDLLVSLGYHDVARELKSRYEEARYDDEA